MEISLLIIGLIVVFADCKCFFPDYIQGKWFQKDIGKVVIGANNITDKGFCADQNREGFYLIQNSRIGCNSCLQMFIRHRNVIQYRESYCTAQDSMDQLCSGIQSTNLMQTLVRENSIGSECPFGDAYHFSYNNNTGGFCRDPTSYVKSCASKSRVRFHFKHCSNAAYTHNQEMDFECLANWEDDDGKRYMYGKFLSGALMQSKNKSYRCFMYQILGTVVYMAMSGDATCRGLRTSNDGPLVYELTKDVFGWPQPVCSFPSWLSQYSWRDLTGMHTLKTNTESNVLTVQYREENNHNRVTTAFRCIKVQRHSKDDRSFMVISYTSDECTPRYQCLLFEKRKDGVVEVHRGQYVKYDSDYCTSDHFNNATQHLLIPALTPLTSCPFQGLHRILDEPAGCDGYIQSGCNGSYSLQIVTPCSRRKSVQLECLKTWGGKRRKFIVAREMGSTSRVANCFVFKDKDDVLQFSTDRSCNLGTPDIFDTSVKFALSRKEEKCFVPKPKTIIGEPSTDSRRTNNERDAGIDDLVQNIQEDEKPPDPTSPNDLDDQKDQLSKSKKKSKDSPLFQISNSSPRTWVVSVLLTIVCDVYVFSHLYTCWDHR